MKPNYSNKKNGSVIILKVLFWLVLIAFLIVGALIFYILFHQDTVPSLDTTPATQPSVVASIPDQTPTEIATVQTVPIVPLTEITTVPTETTAPTEPTPPQMLNSMAALYAQNPDLVGWVKIDGTNIDYPVMYTPNDPEKYLHLNFEQKYSFSGLPFVDVACSMEPESQNIMIYGHNMNNGTMFRDLTRYDMKTYWKAHPVISFTTLYEERQYEIIAAFYDRVYYETEDYFRFYRFIDPQTREEFDEGIAYFKEHSLYETDVTAEYGDDLLTLVTCAYHVSNGRFVVVAKRIA